MYIGIYIYKRKTINKRQVIEALIATSNVLIYDIFLIAFVYSNCCWSFFSLMVHKISIKNTPLELDRKSNNKNYIKKWVWNKS